MKKEAGERFVEKFYENIDSTRAEIKMKEFIAKELEKRDSEWEEKIKKALPENPGGGGGFEAGIENCKEHIKKSLNIK